MFNRISKKFWNKPANATLEGSAWGDLPSEYEDGPRELQFSRNRRGDQRASLRSVTFVGGHMM